MGLKAYNPYAKDTTLCEVGKLIPLTCRHKQRSVQAARVQNYIT